MFIPDPGSWFLPIPVPKIPDPITATKDRGEKICCHTFFVATNFRNNFWNNEEKKFGSVFKELWNLLPKKLPLSSQKYGFGIRDPGSEIRDPRSGIGIWKKPIPDSGSRGKKGTGFRILDPQHCTTAWNTIPVYAKKQTLLYITGGFWNDFRDRRCLSEQLLEPVFRIGSVCYLNCLRLVLFSWKKLNPFFDRSLKNL